VIVDVKKLDPRPNDIYLLCSDGLSGMVSDDEILQGVGDNADDLERACQTLIAKANANGGVDNVSVVLVKFTD
jgi:protein phosphatase